jgi:2,4-dienoyl-CoA reductase-like NADH-dependent reductase (Old Yellow Enzyme family)/thioredoxin reductase
MSTKFPLLLQPAKMGPWDLPNRIVMAPMGSLNADKDGYITDRSIEFYVDKAKGGMGLIFVECTYMDTELSKGEDNCQGLYENGQVTGMARLASCIHDYGAKCVLQLCHIGHQLALSDKMESLGPSEMVEMMGGVMPFPIRGITREEIGKLKEDFAMASWRAKMAGFDGVQIHGAIGHLINMFCTPFYNRREDEYGGSPENRIRLMAEIIQAVHEKCGTDFPVVARICGCDMDPDGITLEEGIIHAQILEKTGIAALHIVGGSNRNVKTINCQYDPRGDFVFIADAMKKAGIKSPIIIDGGLSTPDIAEKVLAEGKADFIGLGRPMLADPDWAIKLQENRPEDIVPCIRCCKGCVGTIEQFNAAIGLRCSVNPRCNLTGYREIRPITKKKKVCVIGGGPAGMEAAKLAVTRGHEVTLYEKRKLGGAMHEAAFDLELKGDIQILIDYYVGQIKKLNINVKNEEAAADKILKENYDAVIVAVGAAPRQTKLIGSDKSHVISVWDYCGNRDKWKELGENVLIVGGGFVGAEIALSLAKKGKKPVLSSRRGGASGLLEIAKDNSSPMQQRLMLLLMERQVEIKLCVNLTKIDDGGVVFTSTTDGEKTEHKCDNVILCRGYVREDGIYNELRGKISELYKVGPDDKESFCQFPCSKARLIHDAIHEGWMIGNRV